MSREDCVKFFADYFIEKLRKVRDFTRILPGFHPPFAEEGVK